MMFKRFRSARTGRYVSPEDAQANQDTTLSEKRLRWPLPPEVERAARACIDRNGLDATLERLAD